MRHVLAVPAVTWPTSLASYEPGHYTLMLMEREEHP